MGIADRRRERVLAMVAPRLDDGEQVQAVLPACQTGPTPLLAIFGVLYMLVFRVRMYALVVTERRIVYVRCSFWTARPQAVERELPIGSVSVVGNRAGAVWGKLELSDGNELLKLNVLRMFHRDAAAAAGALGGAPATP